MGVNVSRYCCSENGEEEPQCDVSVDAVQVVEALEEAPAQVVPSGSLTNSEGTEGTEVPTMTNSELPVSLQATISFKVDRAAAHGIPVFSILRDFGLRKLTSPSYLDLRFQRRLWERSHPAEAFDVFFSHTWNAPGRLKFLSLLFQYGWPTVTVSWLCVVTVAFVQGAFGLVPLPFTFHADTLGFKADCPYAPWAWLSGTLAVLISLFLFPYCCCASCSPTCFLDVASVHQTDPVLKERGVLGLGGFLQISKELRVLWSPTYLSRLWCVFELAAFRKANPSGRIQVKPLFVERQVFFLILACAFMTGIFVAAREGVSQAYQSGMVAIAMSPLALIVHTNRKFMREERQITEALATFELKNAGCQREEDKAFLLAAINAWYGSEEAFTAYVRGPLTRELLAASTLDLPFGYGLLAAASPCCRTVDVLVAMIRAGAPRDVILLRFVASVLGLGLFWNLVFIKAIWWLCRRYAALGSTRLLEYLITLAIASFLCVLQVVVFYVSRLIYTKSPWGCLIVGGVMFVLSMLAYGPPPCCAKGAAKSSLAFLSRLSQGHAGKR